MALKYIVPKPGALKYIVLKLGALKYIVLKPSLVPPLQKRGLMCPQTHSVVVLLGVCWEGGGVESLKYNVLKGPGLEYDVLKCLQAFGKLAQLTCFC